MCTVLLPPGVNPIAVNKYYLMSYFTLSSGSRGLFQCIAQNIGFSLNILREHPEIDLLRLADQPHVKANKYVNLSFIPRHVVLLLPGKIPDTLFC